MIRRAAESGDGRPAGVARAVVVAHDPPMCGEGGQDGMAGGPADVEPAGDVGEGKRAVGLGGQQLHHGDHPLGRR
ncbi:hypothetical protein [Mycolicibacterium peregrinum]|uniref:hypothetical protein n=1 Tax=Mycolicibacterium peregrinum TaxID=43304 RepID=UPI003AAB045F